MIEGQQLAEDLRSLSVSLRNNADKLIRDVRETAERLHAALDRTTGFRERGDARTPRVSRRTDPREASDDPDFDIPEFIPRQ
jgi:hypothetical protein